MTKPSILQALFRRRPAHAEADDLKSNDPERRGQGFFRRGRRKMRAGETEAAIAEFEEALKLVPDFAEAVAARAEALDSLGRTDEARPEYERARRLWATEHSGAADRRYLYRQRGRFTFEVDSYELALSRVRTGSFPHLASGNALLAQGHPQEALKCFERALKIKQNDPDLIALRGEALSMMGSYKHAIDAFDYAMAANPRDLETLNARGIAKLGLADLKGANADWRHQLDLLPSTHFGARACVAMRLADYGIALPEIEKAMAKEPDELYWPIYRQVALCRLGRLFGPIEMDFDRLHPAEIAYLKGVAAVATERQSARANWEESVRQGPVSLIEVCAAHNELSRL